MGTLKNISATIIVSICPLPPFSRRERVNKRRVKDIVKEFTLLCRGLHGTEYAAEYWNSTLELSPNRDLCPQRKTAGCHSSHKPCQWRISWNDCNDNPPRRRTRHETIPAQTCHRINGQTRKSPRWLYGGCPLCPDLSFLFRDRLFLAPSSNLKVFSLEELRAALPACCLMPPSISVLFCLSRSSRGS